MNPDEFDAQPMNLLAQYVGAAAPRWAPGAEVSRNIHDGTRPVPQNAWDGARSARIKWLQGDVARSMEKWRADGAPVRKPHDDQRRIPNHEMDSALAALSKWTRDPSSAPHPGPTPIPYIVPHSYSWFERPYRYMEEEFLHGIVREWQRKTGERL